jgi:hypothetical protein
MRPDSARRLCHHSTSKRRAIPSHLAGQLYFSCKFCPVFRCYSYRRISTGSNRAAARAGISVAPTEMPIAATVIQMPSHTLG